MSKKKIVRITGDTGQCFVDVQVTDYKDIIKCRDKNCMSEERALDRNV